MKKTLIIYCVIFALTMAVPALVCFINGTSSSPQELAGIFRAYITAPECCHLFF